MEIVKLYRIKKDLIEWLYTDSALERGDNLWFYDDYDLENLKCLTIVDLIKEVDDCYYIILEDNEF